MKKIPSSLLCGIALALPVASASAQLFTDNFNLDTASNYTIVSTSDTAPIFGFDYSTMGIPSAPNSGDSSTLGLRTAANVSTGLAQSMFLIPNVSVSGNFTMKFDLWMNYTGTLAGGGAGSTEYFTAGLGVTGTALSGSGTPTDGTWFAANGDGFGTTTYRVYLDGALQGSPSGVYEAGLSFAAQGTNEYYTTAFPGGETAPAAQANPPQSDETNVGALGFAWREVEITRTGNVVEWYIDGLKIATVTDGPSAADTIFIGHWDHANSIAGSDIYQFHIIDNLTVIPEPSTYALFVGLGILGLALWRRSRKSAA